MRVVEVQDLTFSYRNGRVLHGISFAVEAGEVVGIIGPNSAGKTTLLRLLSRVLHEVSFRRQIEELSHLAQRCAAIRPMGSFYRD